MRDAVLFYTLLAFTVALALSAFVREPPEERRAAAHRVGQYAAEKEPGAPGNSEERRGEAPGSRCRWMDVPDV
jgi:hypothetical protein